MLEPDEREAGAADQAPVPAGHAAAGARLLRLRRRRATAEIIGGISKDASVILEVLAEKVHVHRPRPTRPPPSASSLIDA